MKNFSIKKKKLFKTFYILGIVLDAYLLVKYV